MIHDRDYGGIISDVLGALILLAIISVIVSNSSRTVGLINSFFGFLTGALNVTSSPVAPPAQAANASGGSAVTGLNLSDVVSTGAQFFGATGTW